MTRSLSKLKGKVRDGQGQDGLSNTELKTGEASIIMEGRLYEFGNEFGFRLQCNEKSLENVSRGGDSVRLVL